LEWLLGGGLRQLRPGRKTGAQLKKAVAREGAGRRMLDPLRPDLSIAGGDLSIRLMRLQLASEKAAAETKL
jgi:hypothetical protein